MACLIGCLALFVPRFALVLVAIFSDYLGQAFGTALWPCLGFFFLPLTTLVYAWAVHSAGAVQGVYIAAVIVAVLIDIGVIGGSAKEANRS